MNVMNVVNKQQYVLMYPSKEGKIVTILHKDQNGNCLIRFRNGKRDNYHISWLKEIKE